MHCLPVRMSVYHLLCTSLSLPLSPTRSPAEGEERRQAFIVSIFSLETGLVNIVWQTPAGKPRPAPARESRWLEIITTAEEQLAFRQANYNNWVFLQWHWKNSRGLSVSRAFLVPFKADPTSSVFSLPPPPETAASLYTKCDLD